MTSVLLQSHIHLYSELLSYETQDTSIKTHSFYVLLHLSLRWKLALLALAGLAESSCLNSSCRTIIHPVTDTVKPFLV